MTPDAILDAAPLLSGLSPQGRATLRAMARSVRFPAGGAIFAEGDPCPGLYLVGSGRVRIYKTNVLGKEHVLHLVGPGETFAEVAAIGGFDCPAHAEALEATECLLLPRVPFVRALHSDPKLPLQLLAGMASWVHSLIGQLGDLALRDATSRLARFLVQATGSKAGIVALPALKRHVASHLNITSETLSRSLKALEEEGLIESHANGVAIRDPEGLALRAE